MTDKPEQAHKLVGADTIVVCAYRVAECFRILALSASLFMAGCGGSSHMGAPNVTGIFITPAPANQTAYSSLAAPKNQVAFAAYVAYDDGSASPTPLTGVQWSDIDSWVSLTGNVATCTRPAPLPGLQLSTVTATAQVNGKTYSDNSGVYCL